MIVNFKCWHCGTNQRVEAQPMPLDRTGGQSGFYEFDIDCPNCGKNLETVLREKKHEQQLAT